MREATRPREGVLAEARETWCQERLYARRVFGKRGEVSDRVGEGWGAPTLPIVWDMAGAVSPVHLDSVELNKTRKPL